MAESDRGQVVAGGRIRMPWMRYQCVRVPPQAGPSMPMAGGIYRLWSALCHQVTVVATLPIQTRATRV
jgi:hypothetical protein